MTKHTPPPIDPRRIHSPVGVGFLANDPSVENYPADGKYGGPPAAFSNIVSSPTGGAANLTSDGDGRRGVSASGDAPPIRYEGALRDFSSKLPERGAVYKAPIGHNNGVLPPPTTTALLHFYRPPPPIGGVQHSQSISHTNLTAVTETRYSSHRSVTATTDVNNRFLPHRLAGHSNMNSSHSINASGGIGRTMTELIKCMPAWSQGVQHSFARGDVNKFREPTRPLQHIEAGGYAQTMLQSVPADALADPIVAAMVTLQDESWECFVEGDKYMDEVKQYNASNFNVLKEKRNRTHDDNVIQRYEAQIRACIADPDTYAATWELLGIMCSDKLALREHILSHAFVSTLSPAERDNLPKLVSLLDGGVNGATAQLQSSAIDEPIHVGVEALTLSDSEEAVGSANGTEAEEEDTSLSVDGTAGSGSVTIDEEEEEESVESVASTLDDAENDAAELENESDMTPTDHDELAAVVLKKK